MKGRGEEIYRELPSQLDSNTAGRHMKELHDKKRLSFALSMLTPTKYSFDLLDTVKQHHDEMR